jgi:hypothetical protein
MPLLACSCLGHVINRSCQKFNDAERAETPFNGLLFHLTNILGITAKCKHTVQYPNLLLVIRPVVHSEDLPVPRQMETWSVDDENESDIKCNDETQHDLVTGIQYDVDPLFEPSKRH